MQRQPPILTKFPRTAARDHLRKRVVHLRVVTERNGPGSAKLCAGVAVRVARAVNRRCRRVSQSELQGVNWPEDHAKLSVHAPAARGQVQQRFRTLERGLGLENIGRYQFILVVEHAQASAHRPLVSERNSDAQRRAQQPDDRFVRLVTVGDAARTLRIGIMPARRHQRIRNHRQPDGHRQLSEGHCKRRFRQDVQCLIQTAVAGDGGRFLKMPVGRASEKSKIQCRRRLKSQAGGVCAQCAERIFRPGHVRATHRHGAGANAVAVNSIRFRGSVPQGKHGNCSDHAQTVSKMLSSNPIHAMGDGQNPCQPTAWANETVLFSTFHAGNLRKPPAPAVIGVTFLRQCWQSPRHPDACAEATVCSGIGQAGPARVVFAQNPN